MLSDLQARVARIVAALPAARGFALAGGAALVVQGLTDRATNDLDFFTTSPEDIDALRQAIVTALADAGMTAATVIVTKVSVEDEADIGWYDVGRLVWETASSELRIVSNVPCELVVQCEKLDVEPLRG